MLVAVPVPAEVLQYIQALKWPLFAGLALAVFRRPLVKLVDEASDVSGEVMGSKFRLKRRLEKAVRTVDSLEVDAEVAAEPSASGRVIYPDTPRAEIEQKIRTDPTGAVIHAWEQLAEALRDLAVGTGKPRPRAVLAPEVLQSLPPDVGAAVQELRIVRNEVAHAKHPVSYREAEEFVDATDRLAAIVKAYTPLAPIQP